MRIGTWNLQGKCSPLRSEVLVQHDCDVWLLTEVKADTRVSRYASVTTAADMAPHRAWAAVLSRDPVAALPDPHPASAAAGVGEAVFCASVLPWRASGGLDPWAGHNQADRTRSCVEQLMDALPEQPLVWGGDFNHALAGSEVAGSAAGAACIRAAAAARGLGATAVEHHRVDPRLSDHDVYVVQVIDS